MDLIDDLSRTIAQAMMAHKAASEAMAEFERKAAAGDFTGAEESRLTAVANLETYFDLIVAANKKLQRA